MIFPTYHSHCMYCDGEESPEEYLRKAMDAGLFAYGFSSHAPVPFPNDWSMKTADAQDYLSDIRALRSSYAGVIEVYTGMEADFIPGKCNPRQTKQEYGLDYVIGSVHYVKQFNSGVPWQIDGSPEDFERGFSEIFNRQPHALVSEYYSLIRQMAEECPPDIIGHIDKIRMHNGSFRLFNESDGWYRKAVVETLEVIRDTGIIIEVNTRGMYKKGLKEPYPSRWILEKMLDLGIPVMLNSDAHHPSEIIKGYDEVLPLLRAVGFRELMVIRGGGMVGVPISPYAD